MIIEASGIGMDWNSSSIPHHIEKYQSHVNRKYYISASQPASHTIQYYSSESRTILPQFPFFTHTHTPSLSPVCRQHACLPPPVASVKRYPMCLLLVGIQYIVQFHILHPSSMTYQWPYPFSHQRSKKIFLPYYLRLQLTSEESGLTLYPLTLQNYQRILTYLLITTILISQVKISFSHHSDFRLVQVVSLIVVSSIQSNNSNKNLLDKKILWHLFLPIIPMHNTFYLYYRSILLSLLN